MQRRWFDQVGGFSEVLRTGEDKEFTLRLHEQGARLLSVNSSVALHWGYEMNWREWMGKELWRQGSHLQLLRTHGMSLRLLRFPLLSLLVWMTDFLLIVALLAGLAQLAAGAGVHRRRQHHRVGGRARAHLGGGCQVCTEHHQGRQCDMGFSLESSHTQVVFHGLRIDVSALLAVRENPRRRFDGVPFCAPTDTCVPPWR